MSTHNAPVPVQELSYAAPAAPRHTFSWLAFLSTALVMGLVAIVLLAIVPTMKEFYRDVHLQLPLPTQLLVATSDWVTHWGWASFPVIPVVFALIAPRIGSRRQSRTATDHARQVDRLTVIIIALSAALVLLVIMVLCGFMPMITIHVRFSS